MAPIKERYLPLACIIAFVGLVDCATWTSFQSVSLCFTIQWVFADTHYIRPETGYSCPSSEYYLEK